jgi:hypothetical protein
MAISFSGTPTPITPGYNPIVYYVDSTNKNQPGFRYIFQVLSGSTLLADLKIAPRPNDGIGYADVSKIVQNQLPGYSLPPSATTWANADAGSVAEYTIQFGESYTTEYAFIDYIFMSGNTGISGTTAHPFVIGDQVQLILNSTYNDFRDALNGYFTVTAIPDAYSFQLNLSWIGSGPATPGKAYYADARKTRFTGLTATTTIATNEAMKVSEFQSFMSSYPLVPDFVLTGSTSKFLTNIPRSGFRVTPTQHLGINGFDNKVNNAALMWFQNSNGDVFNKSISSSAARIKQIAAGPANAGTLTTVSGTAGLIKDDTEWYEFWTTNSSSGQTSEKLRIDIDNRCVINDVEIAFLDRSGSMSSFAFQNRIFESITTEKETLRREFGTNTANKGFTFNTYDEGMSTYAAGYNNSYELNTNWMTDEMSVYFEELLSSPKTYVRWTDGNWYACQIENGSFQTERSKNQKLIKKKITIKLSIDNPVNI